MTCFPKEITENGIHYTLHGDYYLHDLDSRNLAGKTSATTAACAKRIWKNVVPSYLSD